MYSSATKVKNKLFLALAIASGVTIVELVGGVVSNSIALLSDAGHMFADVMAISLSIFAVGLATKEHTKRLTYGYHRAEVLAALANGIILIVIAVLIVKEAYMRLIDPPTIDIPILLAVASIGLAANVVIAFILKEHEKTSINVRGAYLHVFYDAVSSVGVIIGGVIAVVTHYYAIDPIIAFIIAGLVVRGAASILKDSLHILLEGTPRTAELKRIVDEIKDVNGVIDIHDLHAWTISSGINAMSAHVIIEDQMVSDSSRIINEIDRRMKKKFNISHSTVQLESENKITDIRKAHRNHNDAE